MAAGLKVLNVAVATLHS